MYKILNIQNINMEFIAGTLRSLTIVTYEWQSVKNITK